MNPGGGSSEPNASPESYPERLGSYRLLNVLGQGGMGTVFLAERDDGTYRQDVAVKLLRGGLGGEELVRRFRTEGEILARLEHPNIARLLEGGKTGDDDPYLVMEYVDGEPVDRYCDRHGSTVTQRLGLFVEICGAVQFAHQNLVVHRDLKPGNVLVTEGGVPKLLDFGIAKILRTGDGPSVLEPTVEGLGAMTPEYASPEQIQGGSITTVCDVYSLGILLYELLTGVRPYDFVSYSPAAIVRAVCDEEPARPSTRALGDGGGVRRAERRGTDPRGLARLLTGDLDRIVAKALAKDPEARYGSAEQLADDVRRHLGGMPVKARRATLGYRAGKFLRRHRWPVAAVLAAFVSLIVFVAVLMARQRELVEERLRAEGVKDVLLEVFELPEPTRSRGETVTARELLDRGARTVDGRFDGPPEIRIELMTAIGGTYAGLGLLEEAKELLGEAVAADRAGVSDPLRSGHRRLLLADTHLELGEFDAAAEVSRGALALMRSHRRVSGGDLAAGLIRVAEADFSMGRFEAAEAGFDKALGHARHDASAEVLAEVLGLYGRLEDERGDYDRAEGLIRESLDISRREHGELQPAVALILNDLASVVQKRSPEEAEALYLRALGIQRQVFEGSHHDLATTLNNLGLLDYERQRFDQAEARYREALELRRKTFGSSHPHIAQVLAHLGDLELVRRNLDAAETLYRQALDIFRQELGEDHQEVAVALNNLGRVLLARGQVDEAGERFERSLEMHLRIFGDSHFRVAVMRNNLAQVARQRGELEEARRLYAAALETTRAALGPRHINVCWGLFNQGRFLDELKDTAAALESIRGAVDICSEHLDGDNVMLAKMKAQLAMLEQARGNGGAAQRWFAEAAEVLVRKEPEGSWTQMAVDGSGGGR
ncbi:MAG: serine/threonine-protein kinase [Acidobacteriota bacterium]